MRRLSRFLVLAAAAGLVCWLVPPVHFQWVGGGGTAAPAGAFDAPAYAAEFWNGRMQDGLARAADAGQVLAGLRRDAAAAGRAYGRTVGDSDTLYFLIRGAGVVVAAKGGVGVALGGAGAPADLLLRTGFLFGNAVRDATGLIDASRFANSQDFNAVAEELNHLVERRVLPDLQSGARPGRRLEFVAAAEVDPDDGPVRLLSVVPLEVKFE